MSAVLVLAWVLIGPVGLALIAIGVAWKVDAWRQRRASRPVPYKESSNDN